MVKLLPFIIIPLLVVLGALGYWRYQANKEGLTNPQTSQQVSETQTPAEVPKTLPGLTLEQRVQELEDSLKPGSSTSVQIGQSSSSSLDSRLSAVESAITDLRVRISALEKNSPSSSSTTSYPLYIPLGSGGGPWGDQDWHTLDEYQVSINPDNYSGYSGMQLEANFRLAEAAGTGSVRLYNVTDGNSITSQLDTTSNAFSTKSSSTFKLPSGQKTYTIQVKSSQGKSLFVQSARIKVTF